MNNPIVIAIISAGLSAFVTCTFQMINKFTQTSHTNKVC